MYFIIMDTINIASNLINLFIIIYIIINKYKPSFYFQIFNNNIFKIIILFTMIVINKPITSILISILYIIIIQTERREDFCSCLCGSNNIKPTSCPN